MLRAVTRFNSPIILSQGGVPVGVPSSGTIGNNGALSAITALGTTYSTGIYLYFPANAIAAGVAAGLYYCVMSSTTAGTIYNNTYTSGVPTIPASPTAFATTGPGAYTQATTEITVNTSTLPGGLLNLNGSAQFLDMWECNNTAGNKTVRTKLAAVNYISAVLASNTGAQLPAEIRNAGSQSVQVGFSSGSLAPYGATTGASVYGTTNTAVDQTITRTVQLATATDFIILRSYRTTVYSAP